MGESKVKNGRKNNFLTSKVSLIVIFATFIIFSSLLFLVLGRELLLMNKIKRFGQNLKTSEKNL